MTNSGVRVSIIILEKGHVKAIADVTVSTDIGEITLPGYKVLQKEGAEPWVAPPSKVIGNNGKRSYQKVVDMAQVTHRVIADAVLSEYRRRLKDSEASSPSSRV